MHQYFTSLSFLLWQVDAQPIAAKTTSNARMSESTKVMSSYLAVRANLVEYWKKLTTGQYSTKVLNKTIFNKRQFTSSSRSRLSTVTKGWTWIPSGIRLLRTDFPLTWPLVTWCFVSPVITPSTPTSALPH